ncbi:MAG TPA: caspase family protein, partial [Puia sp.]|nr:caspase family protein [Puia sp.]
MPPLDHTHTKVILIGNSDYPQWPDGNIRNIEVNLKELSDALENPELVGIKHDSISVLDNKGKIKIEIEVNKMITSCTADDSLIIYYAGHGLLDLDTFNKVYLSTADTLIDDKISTCLDSDLMKQRLVKCKARNKIMILDCCYAGRMAGLQADFDSLRKGLWGSTEGVYFLMSSDRDTPSRFDPDNDKIPTFFTQKMVETIQDGADVGDDVWTLDEFFENLKTNWDKTKAPLPLNLTFSTIGKFPFCYNRFRLRKENMIDLDSEEKKFNAIAQDPTTQQLEDFINETKRDDLIGKALDIWEKINGDYAAFESAVKENSFDAFSKFIRERKPFPRLRKQATEKMRSYGIENRNRDTDQDSSFRAPTQERAVSNEKASPSRL